MTSISGPQRAAVIQGYRDLLDFLEAHPEIPINQSYNEVSYSVTGGPDAAERAEVDRIAVVLGVAAEGGTHYRARRSFGPVEYKATAIASDWSARFEAANSYYDNLNPGAPAEAETAGAGA